jgi:branched-chain amino acid transport system substrate-binding protein
MIRSRFLAGSAALAGLAGLPRTSRAAATIRLGYVDSFSGPLSDIGVHHRAGAELAIAAANRRGGARFELVSADDTSRPAVGVTEARRLIEQEKVDALVLGTSSAVTLAVGPIAESLGVFTLAIGAQDTNITGDKAQRVVYRFAPNVQMQIRVVAQRILTFGKKWYFVVDDFAYGKDGYARMSALLKRAGGSEAGADILKLGTEDFSSTLTKIRNSDADVVVLCQGGFDAAKFAGQFVQFGLHKKLHLSGLNMEDYYWKTIDSDALAGSTFAIHWAPSVSESAMKLNRILTAGLKDVPSSRNYFGYVCIEQLVDRLHAAGTTKAEALVAAFADHRFDAYKATPSVWRACDHQCVQDEYAGAIVRNNVREKSGFMFEIVGQIGGTSAAGVCADGDPAAAAAALAGQKVSDRSGYEPKAV